MAPLCRSQRPSGVCCRVEVVKRSDTFSCPWSTPGSDGHLYASVMVTVRNLASVQALFVEAVNVLRTAIAAQPFDG